MIKKNNEKRSTAAALAAGFRPAFYFETFGDYRQKLGFTLADVAEIAEKSLATVRRWEAQNDAPRWLWWLLYCCAGYVLDKDFYGFRIQHGKLWTGTRITHNDGFTRPELTEYAFFRQYTRTLERDLAALLKRPEPAPVRPSNILPFTKKAGH